LISGKDKKQIGKAFEPKRSLFIKTQEVKQGFSQQYHSRACKSEYEQNHYHLKGTFEFPFLHQFV
jgi:hypothetical protein